jgi:tetratricopeptide (TPR) repeat protein
MKEIYELSDDATGRDLVAAQIDRLRLQANEAVAAAIEEGTKADQEELSPVFHETASEPPMQQEVELELPEGPIDFEIEPQQPIAAEEEAPSAREPEASPPFSGELELEIEHTRVAGKGYDKSASLTEETGEAAFGEIELEIDIPEDWAAPAGTGVESASAEDVGFEDVFEGTDFELDMEDAFAGEPEPAVATASAPAGQQSKYAFDGVFSEFKKGIDRQVAKEDTETHYNLGIAYMEMGLCDDAVQEFRNAARDRKRKVDCQTLVAFCFRDRGDFRAAENTLREGLAFDGLTQEEILSLTYELALMYESAGDADSALQALRNVAAIDPGFRDTGEKIAALLGEGETEELIDLDQEEL